MHRRQRRFSARALRFSTWLVLASLLALPVEAQSGTRRDRRGKSGPLPQVRWLDVAVRDGMAFFARTNGLLVLDVTEDLQPVEVGRLNVRASVFDVRLDGPRAWLAAGTHGLMLVDVSNPTEPAVLARHETPGSVRQVVLSGDTAFLADHRHGVVVLDVSHPLRPRRLATLSTRGKALALATDGKIMAIAEGPAGVRLFDVSKPGAPRERAVLSEIEDARDVALVDDLLLVAAARHGLAVYRLAGNASPARIGTLVTGKRQALAVYKAAGGAIVAHGGAGMSIVDLATPASPRVRSELSLPRSFPVLRLALDGSRAYIASDVAGFGVVDMTSLDSPEVVLPNRRRMRITFP